MYRIQIYTTKSWYMLVLRSMYMKYKFQTGALYNHYRELTQEQYSATNSNLPYNDIILFTRLCIRL